MVTEDELCYVRVALSEAQARAGQVTRGTADDLMAELLDVGSHDEVYG